MIGTLTIIYRASSEDEISELHADLEGMMEVDQDDSLDVTGYEEAIALIQEPNTDYVITGAVARRVLSAFENRED